MLSALVAVPAQARQPPARLTFHEAVAKAWERLPQRRAFAARQNTAAAEYSAGGSLFPNAPTATGSYINDNMLGSGNDYITSQVEVSTPVWLPGEGTATQNAARTKGEAIGAEAEAAHLALAVQVLDLTVRARLAQDDRDVAIRRLKAAQALAADATRRFHVGEGAESDSLAADADAATAHIQLLDADARLAAARASLAEVTGDDVIPRLAAAGHAARLSASAAPDALSVHPRVAAAIRAVKAAQAKAQLVRRSNRDDPEIGLQGINEKQPGTPWDTRFGVVVHFAFATEARNAPRRAAAEEQVTQAEVQLEQARRQVVAENRQADAMLAAVQQAEVAAGRAAGEQERRRGMIERSWRLGEMSLIEVVRANALAFDTSLALDKSRTALDAARLRVTLAQGILP